MQNKIYSVVGWLALASAASVLAGCGSSSSSSASGTVKMVASVANYSQTSLFNNAKAKHGLKPLSLSATNTNNLGAYSIFSAAPEAMTVNLMSISGSQSGGQGQQTVSFWTSPNAGGTPITLSSGSIDLTSLGLNQFSVAAGSYTGLTLVFARVGQIKGCLQGTFNGVDPTSATSGTFTYSSPFPTTPLSFTTDGIIAGGTGPYTFCTRADQSVFNAETYSTTAIGTDASYEPSDAYFNGKTDAEFVNVDLGGGNNNNQTMATIESSTVSISSPNAFTVSTSTPVTLSLALDLNRMMEFFSNTRGDFNPPGPQYKTGTSYFFTSKFLPTGNSEAVSAVTVFAGSIGEIQGYQTTVTNGSGTSVSGWFTMYLDSSGNYLGGTFYEDDDDALTILKGNATLTSGTISSSPVISTDISNTTITGFAPTSLNGSGTASLSWDSGTYTLSYERLL